MTWRILNLRPLRSGGNGDLFIGQRSDTGQQVVVKYLRESHLVHARKAFAREVRVLKRRARGMVPLLHADTETDRPYYVMPYLRGGSLSRYAGNLSDIQLHSIAKELALILAGLHAAYVEHGDVKPDNVLASDDGHLQVADPLGNGVGCTVLFSQNHGGTPGYWPPEICAGSPISQAGDVYSYGATLYELSTGRKPQDGQRLDLNSERDVKAPKIRDLIAACCQSDPNARPTMGEVVRILDGKQWADIRAEQEKRKELLKGVCLVGGLALLVTALLNSNG